MDPIVSLEGRTVIVTGAGQGIGRSVSELVVALGGSVVGLDMNAQTLEAVFGGLPPGRAMPVVGRVVDADLAATTVAEAVARFGAVHGLVNNAGITRPAMKRRGRQGGHARHDHVCGSRVGALQRAHQLRVLRRGRGHHARGGAR